MDNISNIPQKIFKFLGLEAERLGKETGFKKRRSKLTPSSFVKALVRACFCQNFTLELLCSFIKDQGIYIKKQSLYERFNERTAEYLKSLSSYLLKQFRTEKLPQLDHFKEFSSINIVDSSSVSLHRSLSHLFKGTGGAASSAAMKIQLMFDYLRGQIKELTLTSGCDNDQGFDNYFREIEKGALYLMDLGYFKLSSFKNIIDGNAFFISRLLTGTRLLTVDKNPFNLLATLVNAGPFFSQNVLLGANHQIPVRLIAQRLPDEIAANRRRALKKDHRRRGTTPSQELLALQSWSIYITNTCETQISNPLIHQTYALRWQVELFFKLSKSLMHIDSINTTKSSRVIIETYSKFIAMMLLFLLCNPAHSLLKKPLSFYKACQQLSAKAAEFITALDSSYRFKRFLNDFYESLSLFALKDTKKNPPLDLKLFDGANF